MVYYFTTGYYCDNTSIIEKNVYEKLSVDTLYLQNDSLLYSGKKICVHFSCIF